MISEQENRKFSYYPVPGKEGWYQYHVGQMIIDGIKPVSLENMLPKKGETIDIIDDSGKVMNSGRVEEVTYSTSGSARGAVFKLK